MPRTKRDPIKDADNPTVANVSLDKFMSRSAREDLLKLQEQIKEALEHKDLSEVTEIKKARIDGASAPKFMSNMILQGKTQERIRSVRPTDDSQPWLMAEVARMRMEGRYWWEIADLLNVSERTIKNIYAKVKTAWSESALYDFNEMKQREVAKIDYLERRNWEEIARVNEIASGRVDGMSELDFRRLKNAQDAIMWCIVQRTKIFGLEAPIKVDWRFEAQRYGIDVDAMYSQLVREFADRIVDASVVEPAGLPAPEASEEYVDASGYSA